MFSYSTNNNSWFNLKHFFFLKTSNLFEHQIGTQTPSLRGLTSRYVLVGYSNEINHKKIFLSSSTNLSIMNSLYRKNHRIYLAWLKESSFLVLINLSLALQSKISELVVFFLEHVIHFRLKSILSQILCGEWYFIACL